MWYYSKVEELAADAEQLEQVYRTAEAASETEAFKDAIDASHASAPENLLYAAWFHRLKYISVEKTGYVVNWAWAIPLAIISGVLFWLLSGDDFILTIDNIEGRTGDFLPGITLLAGPLVALLGLIYITAVGRRRWQLGASIGFLLLAAGAYVLLAYPHTGGVSVQEQYLILMVLHMPLLAWAGVGAFLIAQHRDPVNRISFLIKSIEVVFVGGLFLAALGAFTAITAGMFAALDVEFPEAVLRILIAGGTGLIAVIAIIIIYDPALPPSQQSFEQGMYKLGSTLVRALLPLTLLALIVYLILIPFNFRAPFENRDVLIVYNVMLFAVIALLLGVSWEKPGSVVSLMPRWIRLAVIAVAVLTFVVGLYALAAILYRTVNDGLTPNRFTFIGWNVINLALLLLIVILQLRTKPEQALDHVYRAFSAGTVAYGFWTIAVVLVIPWLF